ncbi:sodium:solute symporter [Endozoicomonas sp. (ex Bugula neritina AB1)]|nr:sodium:solute symporter [Endozoicomonas sp. (ex Bugula neritina AB1)]
MNIYTIGVLTSISFYILIGSYAGRKVKNLDDYYVYGRNAPTLLIVGTMFASMLSTNGFMGDTAYSYSGNITTIMLLNALCAVGYVIGPLFFGRYIRRAKVNTMPSYFWRRFNSVRIRRLAGLTTVVSLFAYLISVILGTGLLMETLLGFSRVECLIIAWLCFTLFTFYSGSYGVVLTDTLMCIFFLVVTLIAGPYIFNAAGGISNLLENLVTNPDTPSGLLDYHGNVGSDSRFDTVAYGFTMGIIWMITVAVSPWQAGRNLMAKNEHVIIRSGVITALLTVIFLLYLHLMAISVIPLNPGMEQPERVLIWAALEVMPKLVGVVMLAGIMTAGLSSASTFLSVVSFSISSDIMNLRFANETAQLKFTRMVVVLVGFLALVIALMNPGSIRIIAWFASTIIAASWGYVAFASVWSKTLTERGAYYAMLGGFFGYLGSKLLVEVFEVPLYNFLEPFFIGLAISATLGILGSRGQVRTKEEVTFLEKLHEIPVEETRVVDYQRDQAYGWGLVFAGIGVSVFLIRYWAVPYNAIRALELLSFIN